MILKKKNVKTTEEQPVKETKSKLINIRVTPSEYEALHTMAKSEGLKLSEFILTNLL